MNEFKSFLASISGPGLEALEGLQSRHEEKLEIQTQSSRTRGPGRIAAQQEAIAKVAELEESVRSIVTTAAPFSEKPMEGAGPLSGEAAKEVCENVMIAEKDCHDALDATRKKLMDLQRQTSEKHEVEEIVKLATPRRWTWPRRRRPRWSTSTSSTPRPCLRSSRT